MLVKTTTRNYQPICIAILITGLLNLCMGFANQKPASAENKAPDAQEQAFSEHTQHGSLRQWHIDPDGERCYDDNCYYEMDSYELGRAYQIEIEDREAIVWQGRRFVGKIPLNKNCVFNKLIIKDNE